MLIFLPENMGKFTWKYVKLHFYILSLFIRLYIARVGSGEVSVSGKKVRIRPDMQPCWEDNIFSFVLAVLVGVWKLTSSTVLVGGLQLYYTSIVKIKFQWLLYHFCLRDVIINGSYR